MRRIIRKRDIVALLMAIVIALGAFALIKVSLVYSHLSANIKHVEIEANAGRNRWDAEDLKNFDEALQEKADFIEKNRIAGFLASFGSSTPKQLLRFLLIGISVATIPVCGILIYIKCLKIRWYLRRTKVRRKRYRQRRLNRRKRRLVNHGLIKS